MTSSRNITTLSRRHFLQAAGSAAGAAALGMPTARAQAGMECIVGTFGGDYLNLLETNIVKPLLEPKGIRVQWDVANTGPKKSKLIAERRLPKGTMDVVILGDSDMYEMSLAEVLEPLNDTNVPNLRNSIPTLRRSYSISQIYSGMVIIQNPQHAQVKSFAEMWDERYRGKIGLVDGSFNWVINVAAMAAGASPNDFEAAKKKLLEWKKLGVRVYPTNEAVGQALQSGEIHIAPLWRARAVLWAKAGIPVTNVVPTEGIIPVTYEAAVAKNAPNKEAALAFINAMLDSRAQSDFAKSMGYAPTVSTAELPPDVAQRISFTPDEAKKMVKLDFDLLAKEYKGLRQWWDREFLA
jgi:putative spermidine/putrescine transport system substrate-binding protein